MIAEMTAIVDAFRDAVKTIKTVQELLPEKEQKDALAKKLEAAERSLALAESKAADLLEYELCRCTFPPQIMLNVGGDRHRWRCGRCGSEDSTRTTVAVSD